MIVKNGKLVYDHTAERQSDDGGASKGQLSNEDANFRWYSMSKVMTTVGVMVLYERNLLDLDDLVSTHLPEWTAPNVAHGDKPNATIESIKIRPAVNKMTIRHLLTHTSGIGYGGLTALYSGGLSAVDLLSQEAGFGIADGYQMNPSAFYDKKDPSSLLQFSKLFSTIPLKFEPGTRWEYSPSHVVCGAIIEKVTGQPYGTWMQENVFKPIGMTGMRGTVSKLTVPMYLTTKETPSHPHRKGISLKVEREDVILNPTHPVWDFDTLLGSEHGRVWPDAGWIGRVQDLTLFVRTLGNGRAPNGHQLLAPATVDLMAHKNHLSNGGFLESGFNVVSEIKTKGFVGHALGGTLMMDGYAESYGSIAAVPELYEWCGIASTSMIIDKKNKMQILFASQVWDVIGVDPTSYGACGQVAGHGRKLIYAAIVDSLNDSNQCDA